MIIEQIILWLQSLLSYAINLLPANGNLFDAIPSLNYKVINAISYLNGYIPIVEIGKIFTIYILMFVAMKGIELTMAIYSQITKLIP